MHSRRGWWASIWGRTRLTPHRGPACLPTLGLRDVRRAKTILVTGGAPHLVMGVDVPYSNRTKG